jgi:hypothetical protein
MQACRRRAPADELDGFITEMRRDQRIVRDVEVITEMVQDISRRGFPGGVADEVAGLLERVRYLLEGA